MEVPFPGLGAARLQTQGGRRGHLLRSVLHTVHSLGEGRAQKDGGLSPEGEMLKGPEKEASSHEAVFPADVKTRCFHFLLQQLKFWSFLLSSVSWQSRFLQFFLKAGLSLQFPVVVQSGDPVDDVRKAQIYSAQFCMLGAC